MDKHVERAIKRLKSSCPLIGGYLRKKGAQALTGTDRVEAVEPLIACLKDRHRSVRNVSLHALKHLKGKARDYLCLIWARTRDPSLEDIIVSSGYVASSPLEVHYLTALKTDKMPASVDIQGINILLKLQYDLDRDVREKAIWLLHSLKDQKSIDYLCQLWERQRDKDLERIIKKAGYIASEPPYLAVLTSFINNVEPPSISEETLKKCLKDKDINIVRAIVDWLVARKGGEAYLLLWDFAKEYPLTHVPYILNSKGWYPPEPAERALFYFLADEPGKYHSIDFEHSILRIWYETGSDSLKEAVASRIRKSGDTRLLAIFRTPEGRGKTKYTSYEVDLQITLLLKSKNYEELFSLLPHANYDQGKKIIWGLFERGWEHPDSRLRECQKRLEELIHTRGNRIYPLSYPMILYNKFRPMLTGTLKIPAEESQLIQWTEDRDFRKRGAGIIGLAEKGSSALGEVANRASRDPYWQVRMAAAMAETLHPGTLTSINKEYLSKDHVYYIRAFFNMPVKERLVDFHPEEIDRLNGYIRPGEGEDFFNLLRDFIPPPDREYILILAEYFMRDIAIGNFHERRVQ